MTTVAEHRDKLLSAFGIGAADLDANRAGRLGATQAQALRRSGWNNLLLTGVVGIILAAILAFVANKPLKPAQYITALVLFGATLAAGVYHFRKTHAAAAEGLVECLTGLAEVQSRGKSGFFLRIAGQSFKLPVRPWNVASGSAYRVYVAPRARLIVAMEPDGTS
jgi:hypothetical protein